jgi:hypothetical protein
MFLLVVKPSMRAGSRKKNAQDLVHLRGFKCADRFELTPEQIMPDIAQPYRFMSVYDLDFCHTGD